MSILFKVIVLQPVNTCIIVRRVVTPGHVTKMAVIPYWIRHTRKPNATRKHHVAVF